MKNPFVLPAFGAALTAAGLLSASHQALATVLPISDATYTGSYTAGTPENITGDATLAGITTTEGTFTGLYGATANNVSTGQVPSSVGTAPASAAVAASGLSANDGVNNLNSGNFQLTLGAFTANTRFFIIESTPTSGTSGDPTTVTLIDASNNRVGTYSLTLTAAQFTNTTANTTNTALATLSYTAGVASLTGGVQSKLGGLTFSLADFTGTGDLSTVTGFALSSGTLDPNIVGAFNAAPANVPEPSTICASLLAGLSLLAVRLRRPASRA